MIPSCTCSVEINQFLHKLLIRLLPMIASDGLLKWINGLCRHFVGFFIMRFLFDFYNYTLDAFFLMNSVYTCVYDFCCCLCLFPDSVCLWAFVT